MDDQDGFNERIRELLAKSEAILGTVDRDGYLDDKEDQFRFSAHEESQIQALVDANQRLKSKLEHQIAVCRKLESTIEKLIKREQLTK